MLVAMTMRAASYGSTGSNTSNIALMQQQRARALSIFEVLKGFLGGRRRPAATSALRRSGEGSLFPFGLESTTPLT